MPRKNHPSHRRQKGHGMVRPQGAHKKHRSDGVARAIKDLQKNAPWWTPDRREEAA